MIRYLDWNATTPRHPDVAAAMEQAEGEAWANPSSVHRAGRAARRYMEDARETMAKALGFSPRDVVLTGGGTEANHLALRGARFLVTTRLEHPSIVSEAERLAEQGCRVVFADVSSDGTIAAEAVAKVLDGLADVPRTPLDYGSGGLTNETVPLVAMSAVNHETGAVQPVLDVIEAAHARGARVHVDAVQLLGRGSLDPVREADSVSVAAHKIRGPKGVGALGFVCGWTPQPLGRGGAQEGGLRPGTIDATAMAGFRAALDRLDQSVRSYREAARLGDALRESLQERYGTRVTFHGPGPDRRLGHVVNFRLDGWKGDELVAALDLEGICVSSGSACSAGTAEPSRVIEAMLGREAAVGAVRVSFGEDSTGEDLKALLGGFKRVTGARST